MDTLSQVAQRHQFSRSAVESMLQALRAGGGSMAQFSHPEFGGMGQWMPGMIMIGDMFNNQLKGRVDSLARELVSLLECAETPLPEPAVNLSSSGMLGMWWPSELGWPTASGSQNNMRYAYFSGSRRLVIDRNGRVSVYDTGDHQITGVQQQSSSLDPEFSSQFGTVNLRNLPQVS